MAEVAGGAGLPQFVEREFREFLTCGVPAHGFTRLRGADCPFDVLACPRGGGRLRVIATVQDPLAVQATLAYLARSGAPAPPGPAPPRPPP